MPTARSRSRPSPTARPRYAVTAVAQGGPRSASSDEYLRATVRPAWRPHQRHRRRAGQVVVAGIPRRYRRRRDQQLPGDGVARAHGWFGDAQCRAAPRRCSCSPTSRMARPMPHGACGEQRRHRPGLRSSPPVTPQASAPEPRLACRARRATDRRPTWVAPANDGGSPLTGYLVQVATSPTGPFADAGCRPRRHTGLHRDRTDQRGAPLPFQVAATNTFGTGAASAVSGAVVPASPSAPTGCRRPQAMLS